MSVLIGGKQSFSDFFRLLFLNKKTKKNKNKIDDRGDGRGRWTDKPNNFYDYR